VWRALVHLRDDEVDQTILKNYFRNSAPCQSDTVMGGRCPRAYICIQAQDDEVKTHRIDEIRSKDCVAGLSDDTTHTIHRTGG